MTTARSHPADMLPAASARATAPAPPRQSAPPLRTDLITRDPDDHLLGLNVTDRTVFLALHVLAVIGVACSVPLTGATPTLRALLDFLLLAMVAAPAVVLAICEVHGRTWWAAATPLASAVYVWLPSADHGSIYADADITVLAGLLFFGPLLSVIAPAVLLARSQAGPWVLTAHGLATVLAPAVVYAALAYPLTF